MVAAVGSCTVLLLAFHCKEDYSRKSKDRVKAFWTVWTANLCLRSSMEKLNKLILKKNKIKKTKQRRFQTNFGLMFLSKFPLLSAHDL